MSRNIQIGRAAPSCRRFEGSCPWHAHSRARLLHHELPHKLLCSPSPFLPLFPLQCHRFLPLEAPPASPSKTSTKQTDRARNGTTPLKLPPPPANAHRVCASLASRAPPKRTIIPHRPFQLAVVCLTASPLRSFVSRPRLYVLAPTSRLFVSPPPPRQPSSPPSVRHLPGHQTSLLREVHAQNCREFHGRSWDAAACLERISPNT
jgi:hypothetical protein